MYIKNKIQFLFPLLFLAGFISFAAPFFNGAAEYKQGRIEYEMLRNIIVDRDYLPEEKHEVQKKQETLEKQETQETQEAQKKQELSLINHKNNHKNKLSRTQSTSKSVDDEALRTKNPDYRFWIKIPDTSIDYPVVKSSLPGYYLNHTFLKVSNSTGCLFIQNDQQGEDENFVVYGHNRKDGSMFGELKKYLDEDYYEVHPQLWVHYEGRWYKGAVFSCQLIGNQNLSCYEAQFSTRQQKEDYINKMKEASIYPIPVYPSWKDPVITLSTCYGSSKRMIVQAVLMCYTE